MRPWRSRPRLARVVGLAIVAWAVVAAALLVVAERAARDGVRRLESIDRAASLDDLDAELGAELEAAASRLSVAHRALTNPAVVPLRHLPILGRQLRSVTALTASARTVAGAGAQAVRDVDAALEAGAGADRVRFARRLATIAGEARRRIEDLDAGPDRALLRTLADRRADFVARVADLRRTLADVEHGAAAVADLLQGPRRYLLLAANNGEMRAGSGMFLSAGVVEIAGGTLALGEVQPTGDLALDAPGVALDPDVAALWGWSDPGREWRNLALTPRFDVTAPQALAMWEARFGERLDGVLAVDVEAVRGVVAATGPVEVDGLRLTADRVVPYLLEEQYEQFTGDDLAGARRDRLADIARAALERVDGGDFELVDLVARLADAARGRHLLAWSPRAQENAAFRAAGISGELTDGSVLLAVLNTGGNKLDSFLHVEGELAADGRDRVSVRLRLENRAPQGQPQYVAGPHPGLDLEPGEYRGLLSLSLPAFAEDVRFEGGTTASLAGADGPTWVVAAPVQIPRGRSSSMEVTFRLPPGHRTIAVRPSARIPPVAWRAGSRTWRDTRTVAIDVDDAARTGVSG